MSLIIRSLKKERDQEIDNGEFRLTTSYSEYFGYLEDDLVFLFDGGGIIPGDIVRIYGEFNGLQEF